MWPVYVFVIFIMLGPTLLIIPFMRFRREKRRRGFLRQAALQGNSQLLTPIQLPFIALQPSLPMRLESRLKKFYKRSAIIALFIFTIMVTANAVNALLDFWDIANVPGLPIYLFVWPISWIILWMQSLVTAHHLHPSLTINEEGITALYGHTTVSIRWIDIRYFALVSSTTFTRKSGKWVWNNTQPREAFEISDGENMITWLTSAPFSSLSLLWNGDFEMPPRDYSSFTQHLASLIVAKTGCPLYDFRLPDSKKKQDRKKVLITSRVS